MENWQSEFLQLIWQIEDISLYVGTLQSKEWDWGKKKKGFNNKDARLKKWQYDIERIGD